MSPLLQLLMNETERSVNTAEAQALDRGILAQQEIIRRELSFDFLNRYSTLCNRRNTLENEACFERGFFLGAQLMLEILSKYSS